MSVYWSSYCMVHVDLFNINCSSDCCLRPTQHFFSYIMGEQVNFQWDDDEIHFVLDQHAFQDVICRCFTDIESGTFWQILCTVHIKYNYKFQDLGTPNEKIWPGLSELPAMKK
jgi:hypothetical protein